jgi:hypothetical protein
MNIRIFLTYFGLLSVLIYISCHKNDDALQDIASTHISIDELVAYLPESLRKKNTVLYKNEDGAEMWLQTEYTKFTQARTEYDLTYTHDNFKVQFRKDEDPNFYMDMHGYGLFTGDKKVQKVVGAQILPPAILASSSGSVSVLIRFETNSTTPMVTIYDNFEESLILQNKVFKNVYTAVNSYNPNNAYSEIKINSNEGIVAFRDKNDVLWVFERFGD